MCVYGGGIHRDTRPIPEEVATGPGDNANNQKHALSALCPMSRNKKREPRQTWKGNQADGNHIKVRMPYSQVDTLQIIYKYE